MSRCILRFQSLVLREQGEDAAIYFEIEDDDTVMQARASIYERDAGAIDVGPPSRRGEMIDSELFASIVRRFYAEKIAILERIGGAVTRGPCVVALGDRAITIEGRAAAGW